MSASSPFAKVEDSFAVIGVAVGVVGEPGRGRFKLGGLRALCLGFTGSLVATKVNQNQ